MILLKNYMEEAVIQATSELLGESDQCQCEKCKADIHAMALNRLPPAYVATRKGELFTAFDKMLRQNQADITQAVLQAMKQVADHPNHDAPREP